MSTLRNLLAFVTLALAMGACGSTSADETTDSTSTTITTTTTAAQRSSTSTTSPVTPATASEPASAAIGDLPAGQGPLPIASGTYRTLLFGDDIGLQVDGPVQLRFHAAEFLALGRTDWTSDDVASVSFAPIVGVMPAAQAGIHQSHDPAIPVSTGPIPDDLVSWLATIDQVRVLDQGASTVLDEAARWVEFEVDPSAGPTFECPSGAACIGLLVNPEGVMTFVPEQRIRLHRFDALPRIMAWERADESTSVGVAALMNELVGGLVRLDQP